MAAASAARTAGEGPSPSLSADRIEPTAVAYADRYPEAALVSKYREWVDPDGSRLRAWPIPVGGEILRADLYDTTLGVLIEAKAAATRNLLRQAIGQLIDYRRYLSPRPRLAVLLPEEPTTDLAALPRELDIGMIWVVDDRSRIRLAASTLSVSKRRLDQTPPRSIECLTR